MFFFFVQLVGCVFSAYITNSMSGISIIPPCHNFSTLSSYSYRYPRFSFFFYYHLRIYISFWMSFGILIEYIIIMETGNNFHRDTYTTYYLEYSHASFRILQMFETKISAASLFFLFLRSSSLDVFWHRLMETGNDFHHDTLLPGALRVMPVIFNLKSTDNEPKCGSRYIAHIIYF